MTSRNGLAEPLYGLTVNATDHHRDTSASATIFVTGRINKTVRLIQPDQGGRDFPTVAGQRLLCTVARAVTGFPVPKRPRIFTRHRPRRGAVVHTGRLVYNPLNPLAKITGHPLNFDATNGSGQIIHDGEDALFGEGGDDWLVGGTDVDYLFGGAGNDTINADDNLDTNSGPTLRPRALQQCGHRLR